MARPPRFRVNDLVLTVSTANRGGDPAFAAPGGGGDCVCTGCSICSGCTCTQGCCCSCSICSTSLADEVERNLTDIQTLKADLRQQLEMIERVAARNDDREP